MMIMSLNECVAGMIPGRFLNTLNLGSFYTPTFPCVSIQILDIPSFWKYIVEMKLAA